MTPALDTLMSSLSLQKGTSLLRSIMRTALALGVLPFVTPACGSDKSPACSVDPQSGCAAGQTCENVANGGTACFAPVFVEGKVTSSADSKPVAGALVVARDANDAVASYDVATSAADGTYKLAIPTTRNTDGKPTLPTFALRADAAGFATFPSGLRISLPIDVSSPVRQPDGSWVVQNAGTDVSLDPLANASSLGTISGTVQGAPTTGTLVVAADASGIAARDGSFSIFNVPAGSQTVSGYLQGTNFTPATATVTAGQQTKGVTLAASGAATANVTGDIQIVNPSQGSAQSTSVVLVVDSTFNTTTARGEVPKGLRAANVSGAFTITGVPNGTYVVLAAFENDGLVRDPDTAIGGTAIQKVKVAGGSTAAGSFKVTGALATVSPGADGPEAVSSAMPSFTWGDDSSEDGYDLSVFDGFGKVVWQSPSLPAVTGSSTVSATYAGPALEPGYYQFRAASFRSKTGTKTYIAMTEDLKGVFIVK
jgi:hypothetical protein